MNRSVDTELQGVLELHAHVWNTHRTEEFGRQFSPAAHFVSALGLHWVGREEIVAALAAMHATVHRSSRLTITPTHIRRFGSRLALMHATWELAGQRGIDDQVLLPRTGALTTVLERRDGVWSIAAYHETAVANPREPIVGDV